EMLFALADFHCQGYDVPWGALYREVPQRVALPGYPFAKDHCWIEEQPEDPVASRPTSAPENALHLLVDRDASTPDERRFVGAFAGDECFLVGHRQGTEQFAPALFYPEMARFAAEQVL